LPKDGTVTRMTTGITTYVMASVTEGPAFTRRRALTSFLDSATELPMCHERNISLAGLAVGLFIVWLSYGHRAFAVLLDGTILSWGRKGTGTHLGLVLVCQSSRQVVEQSTYRFQTLLVLV
jgi:hypothetical protein